MNLNDLKTKELNLTDIQQIYHTYLVKHFPANELKPLNYIIELHEKGIYCAYGLFHEDTLLSYAFVASLPQSDYYLLDYYAVLPKYRSSGIGGIFLTLLKETFPNACGFFIEVEDPDFSDTEEEKKIRLRRISFYHNHCVGDTLLFSRQFGVDYHILFLPLHAKPSSGILYEELYQIYQFVFADGLLNKTVDLRLSE